jgi:glutathione S-transferase
MKLYYTPGACSLAPHFVLAELGMEYQLVHVDLRSKAIPGGDFLSVSPKGYVPALQLSNGEVLTECTAILQYLAEKKPESNLLPPQGQFSRYRCLEWLNYIATELHKGFGPLWDPTSTADAQKAAKDRLSKRLGLVEQALQNQDYLLGTQYSIADAYLFTVLSWSHYVKFDLSPWPKILGFIERVQGRPATQRVLREEGLSK